MHKKLESELMSLAHHILQMKDREDLLALRERANALSERLNLLALIDRYEQLPTTEQSKSELNSQYDYDLLVSKEERTISEKLELVKEEEETVQLETSDSGLETVDLGVTYSFDDFSEPVSDVKEKVIEEELEGDVVDEQTMDLFSSADTSNQKSLNDVLFQRQLKIGLNDRIAFVKQLFDGSQGDFNRVISQLNSFQTKKEAYQFIKSTVKPDYDWSNNEELEGRLFELIDRKFS